MSNLCAGASYRQHRLKKNSVYEDREGEKKTAAYKLGKCGKLRLNLTSEGPEEAAKIKKV